MLIHCVQPPRRDAWEASPHCHGMARCARTPEGTLTEDFDPICGPRPSKLPRPSSPEGTGYLRAGRSAEGPNCQNTLQPSGPEGNGYYPGRGKARRQHEKRRKRRRGGLLIQAGSEAERGLPIQAGREAERGVLRAPEKGFQGRVLKYGHLLAWSSHQKRPAKSWCARISSPKETYRRLV